MKIVVAPDSFKECLDAGEVASAISEGVLAVFPEASVMSIPLSDGGEGMAAILAGRLGGQMVKVPVTGPMGGTVEAYYYKSGRTAILDVASACGLAYVPPAMRNPLAASSEGVGELMAAALKSGCDRLIVGLGGSATCDGGEGMMRVPGLCAMSQGVEILAFCDVDSPFVGPRGAARVYGPQKGADPLMVELLEERMENMAASILSRTGTDVSGMKGAGAAGGLGGALHACLGARLVPGIEAVLDTVGFDKEVAGADFIITGEGTSDRQTLAGKVPMGVLGRSGGIPVFLLSGRIRDMDGLRGAGFSGLFQASPDDIPVAVAIRPDVARENLRIAASRLCTGIPDFFRIFNR